MGCRRKLTAAVSQVVKSNESSFASRASIVGICLPNVGAVSHSKSRVDGGVLLPACIATEEAFVILVQAGAGAVRSIVCDL